MPKFGANLSMLFTEYDLSKRLQLARKYGFRGVEYLFPYSETIDFWQEQLAANDLSMVLFNTPPGNTDKGDWGMAAIPGREQETHDGVMLALEYAQALNCPSIHIMAGVAVDPTPEHEDVLRENLNWAAQQCQKSGKQLLIEALSPGVKPGYFYASQRQTADWVKSIRQPALRMQLDLFHAAMVDGDVFPILQAYDGLYAHVQIASVPHRKEPGSVGDTIDWLSVFNWLDQHDYQGWVGCEYHPAVGTADGLKWLNTLHVNNA